MTIKNSSNKYTLFFSAALALATSPLLMNSDTVTSFFVDEVIASSDHASGGHSNHTSDGNNGVGQRTRAGKGVVSGQSGKGMEHGKNSISQLLNADVRDKNSERPEWVLELGEKRGEGSSGNHEEHDHDDEHDSESHH